MTKSKRPANILPNADRGRIYLFSAVYMKKSLTKRIRITKNGKIIRRHMGGGHNGTRKGSNQKRRITNDGIIHGSDARLIMQEFNRSLFLQKAGRPNKAN